MIVKLLNRSTLNWASITYGAWLTAYGALTDENRAADTITVDGTAYYLSSFQINPDTTRVI